MIEALRRALIAARSPLADAPMQLLADKGLAHAHVRLNVRINGTGVLARLPKQSQLGLSAPEHLRYEAACFERAAPSGHTPRLHGVLAPSLHLPRGGLLVEEIIGRTARLPADLPAIAQTLAAMHALPMPPHAKRPPLLDPADALLALRDEIAAQALHLDAAALHAEARGAIDTELHRLDALCSNAARPAARLIAFDAHPGNFLVDDSGRAVLVDLEKARYGAPPLDLAHATLYTSTTWDLASSAVLNLDELLLAYGAWREACRDAAAFDAWLVPLRRAMWLWSVSWCAKWRVLSAREALNGADGEDWSAERSDAALVRHVRDRVDHYLSPEIVHRVCAEADELEGLLER